MSSNEALAKFMRNPRPFLAPHLPRPPCKLCILGPPHSGKTTLAKMLAERYDAKVRRVLIIKVLGKKRDVIFLCAQFQEIWVCVIFMPF